MKKIVTLFKTVRDREPKQVDMLESLHHYHRSDNQHKVFVERLRGETIPEKRDKMKRGLPALCVGSLFKGGGSADNIKGKTNYLFIDMDCTSVEEAIKVKTEVLNELKDSILYVALSVSETGVHVVIEVSDSQDKRSHWNGFVKKYNYKGWPIDMSTNDVDTRKMFIGCDPDAFIRDAEVVHPFTEGATGAIAIPDFKPGEVMESEDHKTMVNRIYKRATQSKRIFVDGKRNAFIMGIGYEANRIGVPVDVLITELSQHIDLLQHPEHLKTLKYIYITKKEEFGTIKRKVYAKNEEMSIREVEQHLTPYKFRYNNITCKLEYCDGKTEEFKELNDYYLNSINADLWRKGIRCSMQTLRTVLNSDFSPSYDPFENYFLNLPDWDGVDHIKLLMDTVQVEDIPYWNKTFPKWLVGMVASVLETAIVNHTVLVLTGNQGLGKTTWLLNIIPEKLRKYTYTGAIDPDNKDTLVHLSECILINLDELENLNRSQLGSLKELITKPSIRIRRPYGYTNENLPRRATFTGSVNNPFFLADLTGSRRFLCHHAQDLKYQHTVELDKVYAQALHMLRNGFRYWFDKGEINEVNDANEKYRVISTEEELLLTYFEPDHSSEPECFFTTTLIAKRLSEMGGLKGSNINVYFLGKLLKKHGFPRLKKGAVYGYKLKYRLDAPNYAGNQLVIQPFDSAETEKG